MITKFSDYNIIYGDNKFKNVCNNYPDQSVKFYELMLEYGGIYH